MLIVLLPDITVTPETASADDYASISTTVTFEEGATFVTLPINLATDTALEGTECFYVSISVSNSCNEQRVSETSNTAKIFILDQSCKFFMLLFNLIKSSGRVSRKRTRHNRNSLKYEICTRQKKTLFSIPPFRQ